MKRSRITGDLVVWVDVVRYQDGYGVKSPSGAQIGIPEKIAEQTAIKWPVRIYQTGHQGPVQLEITLKVMRTLLDHADPDFKFNPYVAPVNRQKIINEDKMKPTGKSKKIINNQNQVR